MSRPLRCGARRQRGLAAVELAFIMPIFLLLLALPLYFGRVFWHYTVAQKAAHDAARYMSSVSLSELKDPTRIAHVVALATDIVTAETAELNPGTYPPSITVLCDGLACAGFTTPATVTVGVQLYMDDIFFSDITSSVLGGLASLPLTATVTFPCARN